MEKIKIKIEAIKTLLNYVVIVLFGSASYVFINYEKLNGVKIVACGALCCVMFVAMISLLAVYAGILKRL